MKFDLRVRRPVDRGAWAGVLGPVALLAVALAFGPGGKTSAPERAVTPPALPGASLTVEVGPDGAVSPPDLEARAARELATGAPNVAVRVDPRAPGAAVSQTLGRLKKAGISTVRIELHDAGARR